MSRIKKREQSEKVAHSVYRYSGKRNIIVGIVTTLDMYSRIILRAGLYSRKTPEKSDRIGIAQYLRQILYLSEIYLCNSLLSILYRRGVLMGDKQSAVDSDI